jgi:hypothetical protein
MENQCGYLEIEVYFLPLLDHFRLFRFLKSTTIRANPPNLRSKNLTTDFAD